jgi:ankyrin repeat protein
MGACCTTTDKKERRTSNRNSTPNMKVDEIPDEASFVGNEGKRNEKPIIKYIVTGDTQKIQELIDKNEIQVDEYIFGGSDKTILHEAVQVSQSPEVVDLLLNNRADVNAIEKETGNTALILAALDLKVDIVKVILKHKPNIKIKNRKGQDVFVVIQEYLIEKKGTKKTDLTPEQNEKLSKIIEFLKEYKVKVESVENLDDDEKRNMKNSALDESGPIKNRI